MRLFFSFIFCVKELRIHCGCMKIIINNFFFDPLGLMNLMNYFGDENVEMMEEILKILRLLNYNPKCGFGGMKIYLV